MKMSDIKQGHKLGLKFHFSFIGAMDGAGWSCCAYLQDNWDTDREGLGNFLRTARGEYKRHKTIDAWLRELITIGAPSDCNRSAYSIVFSCLPSLKEPFPDLSPVDQAELDQAEIAFTNHDR